MDDIILDHRIQARWSAKSPNRRRVEDCIPSIPSDLFKDCLTQRIGEYYQHKVRGRPAPVAVQLSPTRVDAPAQSDPSIVWWWVLAALLGIVIVWLLYKNLPKGLPQMKKMFSDYKINFGQWKK